MITVDKLSWSFPQKDLYNDISFEIEDGRHCVLVGSNGTGKTTLADIIAAPDSYVIHHGRVRKNPGCRTGYVNQYVKHDKQQDVSVFQYLCKDFAAMQAETERICAEMETAEDYEAVFERYQASLDAFDAIDGYNYETNIHLRLATAGLQKLENISIADISGGEFKLVQIIREMLRMPDLLIMDEPDAFLDFENICGLCGLINGHSGTMLVVTHNRYLLNHCFDQVLHIENMGLRSYDGSYPEYTCALLQMKADMQETSQKETEWVEIQRELVERLRDEATKVIDPYRGKKLHARVSYLARLEAKRTEEPFLEVRDITIKLPALPAEETDGEETYALKVTDYSLAFEEPLLSDVSFELGLHDKCVIVGANGTGKSTMLRQIRQGIASAEFNTKLETAYLSQIYGEVLPEELNAYEIFRDLGFDSREEIEAYLGNFGLEADTLRTPTGVLSGGEKNLMQLAAIGRSSASMLILDEPTSHLDLKAQLAFEKAVREYSGAVLMVSHDFYTIANCADYVLYVDNGTIRKMSGRAFRKMVYKKYFSSEYVQLEQQKKELELKIESMLNVHDYQNAKQQCLLLEDVNRKMS